MLRVFRGAVPLLAALALAGPAAADSPADDALPLPCVVPPRRTMLEPLKGQAAATAPGVDLFAPPPTAVVPSGLPVHSPVVSAPPRNPVVAAPGRPTLHPQTTAGRAVHSWPAPFVTCKEPAAPETKQAVYVETPAGPADTAADDDSAAVADLRERVHSLYGGAAGDADKMGKNVDLPQLGEQGVRVRLDKER